MIRVRLTDAMVAAFGFDDAGMLHDLRLRVSTVGHHVFEGDEDAIRGVAELAEYRASQADVPGQQRQTAKFLGRRCRQALRDAAERASAAIPVSIPRDEQDALRSLAKDPLTTTVALTVCDRLARRELVREEPAGWSLTVRGRAVVDGTPPGDLVPWAVLRQGARVALLYPTELADGGELPPGTELLVATATNGRVHAVTAHDDPERRVPVEGLHPKILRVLTVPR